MKPEWGSKHECAECGAHFYDMRKPDACCPKCQTPVNDEAALIAKKGELVAEAPEEKTDELDELEAIETSFEDDAPEDFMEDTDDLVGNDEADMSEIMDHMDEAVVDQNM